MNLEEAMINIESALSNLPQHYPYRDIAFQSLGALHAYLASFGYVRPKTIMVIGENENDIITIRKAD